MNLRLLNRNHANPKRPAAALALAGCTLLTGPGPDVHGKTPIEPEPAWRTAYGEMEACSGLEGDVGAVRWFAADSIVGDVRHRGAFQPPHDIILSTRQLRRGGDPLLNTVRHESLHDLTGSVRHTGQVWCECDPDPLRFAHCRR